MDKDRKKKERSGAGTEPPKMLCTPPSSPRARKCPPAPRRPGPRQGERYAEVAWTRGRSLQKRARRLFASPDPPPRVVSPAIETLPVELVVHILRFCDMPDLESVALVSGRLREAATDPRLRHYAYERAFPRCPQAHWCRGCVTDVVDPRFLTHGFAGMGVPPFGSLEQEAQRAVDDVQSPAWLSGLVARFVVCCVEIASSSARDPRTVAQRARNTMGDTDVYVDLSDDSECVHLPPSVMAVEGPTMAFYLSHDLAAPLWTTNKRSSSTVVTMLDYAGNAGADGYVAFGCDGVYLHTHMAWKHKSGREGATRSVNLHTGLATYAAAPTMAARLLLAEAGGPSVCVTVQVPISPDCSERDASWLASVEPAPCTPGPDDRGTAAPAPRTLTVSQSGDRTVLCRAPTLAGGKRHHPDSLSTARIGMSGHGSMHSTLLGTRYRGQIGFGMRHGHGTLVLPANCTRPTDVEIYNGWWWHDMPSGVEGRLRTSAGTLLYEGCFYQGLPKGVGTLYVGGYAVHARWQPCREHGLCGTPLCVAVRPVDHGYIDTPDGTRLVCRWSERAARPVVRRVCLQRHATATTTTTAATGSVLCEEADVAIVESAMPASGPRRRIDLSKPPPSFAQEAMALLEPEPAAFWGDDAAAGGTDSVARFAALTPDATGPARRVRHGIQPAAIPTTPRQRKDAQKRWAPHLITPHAHRTSTPRSHDDPQQVPRTDQWLAATLAHPALRFDLDLAAYHEPPIRIDLLSVDL